MVPSLGTLDLGTWEKVHSKLEKLRPVSVWSIWTLIKSILEPLQTPESSEGSEDEGETRSKGEPEYAKPKGIEQKTQETLKATFCTFVWGGRISFTSSSSPSCLNSWSDSSFFFLVLDSSSVTPPERYLSDSTGG